MVVRPCSRTSAVHCGGCQEDACQPQEQRVLGLTTTTEPNPTHPHEPWASRVALHRPCPAHRPWAGWMDCQKQTNSLGGTHRRCGCQAGTRCTRTRRYRRRCCWCRRRRLNSNPWYEEERTRSQAARRASCPPTHSAPPLVCVCGVCLPAVWEARRSPQPSWAHSACGSTLCAAGRRKGCATPARLVWGCVSGRV